MDIHGPKPSTHRSGAAAAPYERRMQRDRMQRDRLKPVPSGYAAASDRAVEPVVGAYLETRRSYMPFLHVVVHVAVHVVEHDAVVWQCGM